MEKYLSIDIGGTFIKYGIIDKSMNIYRKKKVKSPKFIESFEFQLFDIIESYNNFIVDIFISLPGTIDSKNSIVYSGGALPYLNKYNFKKRITEKFPHFSVYIENDAKSAALAEYNFGNLKGISNSAIIILGTGVGGGIIINDSLFKGTNFKAGEFSFILNENTIVGNKLSSVKMIEEISDKLSHQRNSNGFKVFDAIESGNSEAIRLFEKYCMDVANLILNIQSILDLSKIVIGGGISDRDILIKYINRSYDKLIDDIPIIKETLSRPLIERAYFGSNANLYGGLCIIP